MPCNGLIYAAPHNCACYPEAKLSGFNALAPAAATPLTPFRYEAQAQRHCPADTVVWLDFRKGIYYAKRQKFYGRGSNGGFACLEEVRSNGYRRSLLGLR